MPMPRPLSELTLEELWELFPIVLTEHRAEWRDFYLEMEAKLKRAFTIFPIVRISHIGSTVIPSIWAKPIVDILVEAAQGVELNEIAERAEDLGYLRMSDAADRISLNFGYTVYGFAEKVYHLHLRRVGDNDELYFRDYMIEHPNIASEYETLKLSLWKQYEHDRDGYTAAKTDFIRRYTAEARALYGKRYF